MGYQTWYSEAIAIIKICLPDRFEDFKKLYERENKRKDITSENYVLEDALIGLNVSYHGETKCDFKSAFSKFVIQLTILLAVKKTFKSSLFSLRTMLQADLFDDDISAAQNLNKNGFSRAAGAMCGVVIEKHLNEICDSHDIVINKNNPTINDFNESLKANNIYEISSFRKIQYLADIRNKCDHKKDEEPSKQEVDDLINGTTWLIKNIF